MRRAGFKHCSVKRRRRGSGDVSQSDLRDILGQKTLGREYSQRPYRTPTQVGEGKYLQVDE